MNSQTGVLLASTTNTAGATSPVQLPGQGATQGDLLVFHEEIWAEPDTAAHRLDLTCRVVPVAVSEQARFVKALHDPGRGLEGRERFFQRAFPFSLRNIGPDDDSTTPPP